MAGANIETYYASRLNDLPDTARYGLYIVRSVASPDLGRAGAAGFKGSIGARLRTHARRQPESPGNWTLRNRPFSPVWVACLPDTDSIATLCCERELLATLARHVRFLNESGFVAGDMSDAQLVDIAEACVPAMEDLLRRQIGPR